MNKKALYFTIRNVIYSFIMAFIFAIIGMHLEPTMIDGAHWALYPFIWVTWFFLGLFASMVVILVFVIVVVTPIAVFINVIISWYKSYEKKYEVKDEDMH